MVLSCQDTACSHPIYQYTAVMVLLFTLRLTHWSVTFYTAAEGCPVRCSMLKDSGELHNSLPSSILTPSYNLAIFQKVDYNTVYFCVCFLILLTYLAICKKGLSSHFQKLDNNNTILFAIYFLLLLTTLLISKRGLSSHFQTIRRECYFETRKVTYPFRGQNLVWGWRQSVPWKDEVTFLIKYVIIF